MTLLERYNQNDHSINIYDCKKVDDRIYLYNKLFAIFDGEKFDFVGQEQERFKRAQYCLRNIDNPLLLYNFNFAVQEVRKCLTFDEALYLIWMRDTNQVWSVTNTTLAIENKVRQVLQKAYFDKYNGDDWKHFCMCAVYGVKNDN